MEYTLQQCSDFVNLAMHLRMISSSAFKSLWSCCLSLKPVHPDKDHKAVDLCPGDRASDLDSILAALQQLFPLQPCLGLGSVEEHVLGLGVLSNSDGHLCGKNLFRMICPAASAVPFPCQ